MELAHLSDLELVLMQHQLRALATDKPSLDEVLAELGRRARNQNAARAAGETRHDSDRRDR